MGSVLFPCWLRFFKHSVGCHVRRKLVDCYGKIRKLSWKSLDLIFLRWPQPTLRTWFDSCAVSFPSTVIILISNQRVYYLLYINIISRYKLTSPTPWEGVKKLVVSQILTPSCRWCNILLVLNTLQSGSPVSHTRIFLVSCFIDWDIFSSLSSTFFLTLLDKTDGIGQVRDDRQKVWYSGKRVEPMQVVETCGRFQTEETHSFLGDENIFMTSDPMHNWK